MAYLFNTPEDVAEMLATIGAATLEELFQPIPTHLRLKRPLQIPAALSELELTRRLGDLAARNRSGSQAVCFLGGGAYDHFIPAVVDQLAGRGEFYTSYTPYQPEVSQGNLQVMFEYETLICQLTGMDVSNASLYDGATAMVEAVSLAMASRPSCPRIVVSESLHPHYRQVLGTYLQWNQWELTTVACPDGSIAAAEWEAAMGDDVGCVVLSQPNFFGVVQDLQPLAEAARQHQAVVVGVCDMISLGLLSSPREWGADIVVGEGQCLGNPLQFGGPYLGILACRDSFVRRMPGRIAGQTEDRQGRRCWVLTLQTREQHIRRDKATSNICTNQGLFALRAAIYLALQGPHGLRETAEHCAWKTHYLRNALQNHERFRPRFEGASWREIVIQDRAHDVAGVLDHCLQQGMLAGLALQPWYSGLSDCFSIAVTEKRTREELDQLLRTLDQVPQPRELAHA